MLSLWLIGSAPRPRPRRSRIRWNTPGVSARIAEAKRREERERLREELARPPMERLLEGLVLGEAAQGTPAIEQSLDERALGRAALHMRARRLGLIR